MPIALFVVVTAAIVGRSEFAATARQATVAAVTVVVAIVEALVLEKSQATGVEGAVTAAVAGVALVRAFWPKGA